jgi:5-carboxymethyl-2-hydroxymuconate isomerase
MLNVTVTYTDNLGPEADIPALLAKIAARLEADFGRESMAGVCIGAARLADFVVGDGRADWASVAVVARLPADRVAPLRERLLEDLTTLVEAQLADFYRGRSLTIWVELVPVEAGNVVARLNLGPPRGSGYEAS